MSINTTRYCWVIGNTGFRESALYEKIESYLMLLEQFHEQGFTWQSNQKNFFEMMKRVGFMEQASTSERNAPKAARLKTSPLEKLGLVNENRQITEVGHELLKRSKERKSQEMVADNEYFLENDGDIYIKQLIKFHFHANRDEELGIRPFILVLEFMQEFEYLTHRELAYILPLIITDSLVKDGREAIRSYRQTIFEGKVSEKDWIKTYLINHKNKLRNIERIKGYIQDDLRNIENGFEQSSQKDIEAFIIRIDDNGKSKAYSKKLYKMIAGLYKLWQSTKDNHLVDVHKAMDEVIDGIEDVSTTQQKEWRRVLFGIENKSSLRSLSGYKYERYHTYFVEHFYQEDFEAFLLMILDHLWYIKIYNNLRDYEDHNTRYFKLSGIFETVYIDGESGLKISDFYSVLVDKILAEQRTFSLIFDKKEYRKMLYSDKTVLPKLDERDMTTLATKFIDSAELKDILDVKERPDAMNQKEWLNHLKRLHRLSKVNKMVKAIRKGIVNEEESNLIKCLELIKNRKDKQLRELMEIEADVPTVFEYLIWQVFLVLGDYSDDPIQYANFSFDNDLKPVQHAGGGLADVVYSYSDHDVILEATLTKEENQRKLEMEPVPRHLARHRHKVRDMAYCIFVAPYIDPNVAVVHRSFRTNPYYIKESGSYSAVEEMAILPLGIDELKKLLYYSITKNMGYDMIRQELFKPLIRHKELNGWQWFKQVIQPRIAEL